MMRFKTIPYMEWAKNLHDRLGDNVLDLASSEMPSPAESFEEMGIHIQNAPIGGDNLYGYSRLKTGIAERYGVEPRNVFTTQGSSMANFVLLAALTNQGDNLLVETPVYQCLTASSVSLGLQVHSFARQYSDGWQLDADTIIERAKETKARGIIITNPHNPTGIVCSNRVIEDIADGVGEDVFVMVDEVYSEWFRDRKGCTSALTRTNIFATSSLAKVWGLGSLRCGWLIAPGNIVEKTGKAYDNLGVIQPFLMDWISAEIFENENLLDEIRDKNIKSLATTRKIIDKFLAESTKIINTVMAEEGGIGFLEIEGSGSDELEEDWRINRNVSVVPGSFFGDKKRIRVSWTRGEKIVAEAIHRIEG
ncbi:MAG: pyridoxal phosphate-dependent aminotransferase [Candidatus Electryonea clarkiae]|nr:pyridoxal phosphate-dependent aminotransferase [Candidatus Electryonea clarkiae]MDP8286212.1 pyridoxal phosphate-dependent aminotransferase [Candidatus Electryonea clarkiae]